MEQGNKKSFERPFLSGFSILSGCVTVGSVRLRLPFVLPAQALPRGGTIISPWSELAVSKLNNAAPKAIIQIFGERSIASSLPIRVEKMKKRTKRGELGRNRRT